MFSCMTVEDSEKTLPSYACIVDNERMGVFHVASRAYILGDTNLVGSVSYRVLVQDLRVELNIMVQLRHESTYTEGVNAIGSCD